MNENLVPEGFSCCIPIVNKTYPFIVQSLIEFVGVLILTLDMEVSMGSTRNVPFGFTLIELLIVVAVMGILAAIAIPSYMDYVRKSRRADAHAALLKIQQDQEKFRANCPLYAQGVGGADNCTTRVLKGSSNSPDGYYTVALSGSTATGYTVTATAIGAQASDTTCPTITLQMLNGTAAYGGNGLYPNNGCWNK